MKDANSEQSCLKSMCTGPSALLLSRIRLTPAVPRPKKGWQRVDSRGNGPPTAVHDHNISIPYSNVRAVNPKSVDAAET